MSNGTLGGFFLEYEFVFQKSQNQSTAVFCLWPNTAATQQQQFLDTPPKTSMSPKNGIISVGHTSFNH